MTWNQLPKAHSSGDADKLIKIPKQDAVAK